MMGEKHEKNKKMFHAQFHFANGDLHHLLLLLKKAYPSNAIHVLFQYPSPGMDE